MTVTRAIIQAHVSSRFKRARALLKRGNARGAMRILKKTRKFMHHKRFQWLVRTKGEALSVLEQDAMKDRTRQEREAIKYQAFKAKRIKSIASRFKERHPMRRRVKSMENERIMKVVSITPHLSVAIRNNKIVTIVDGKVIGTCRYALLRASPTDTEIETADDLIKHTLSEDKIKEIKIEAGVTIDDELFAHASNLQGWVNHDYAPHLLDSHIAKPILEALIDVDERAKARFLATVREALYGGSQVVQNFVFDKYFSLIMQSDLADDPLVVKLKGNRHYCLDLFDCASTNYAPVGFSRDSGFIAFDSDATRDLFLKHHEFATGINTILALSTFCFASDKSYKGVRERYCYGEDVGNNINYVVLGDYDSITYVDTLDDLATFFIKDLGKHHPSRTVESLQKLMAHLNVASIAVDEVLIEQTGNYMLLYDDTGEMPEIVDESTLKRIWHDQGRTEDAYYYRVLDGKDILHSGKYILQTISRYQGSADYSANFIDADDLPDDLKTKLGITHE